MNPIFLNLIHYLIKMKKNGMKLRMKFWARKIYFRQYKTNKMNQTMIKVLKKTII